MITLSRSCNTILALALVAAAGGGCTKAARTNRAVDRADLFFQAEEYGKAEVAYSNACRMVSPPNPRALRQLGLVFAKEGRPAAAFALLQWAATNEPNNAEVQIELASILPMAGRIADAKRSALRALQLLPGNERALLALCDTIRGAEDAEQTRHAIEQLQKQDQDRASYHLAFGMIDARETNLAAAESEFNKARSMDPKSCFVYVGLAKLSEIHKNLKGADESFKTAVDLAPLRSLVRIMYAEFQAQTGATNQARQSMMDLIGKAPDYLPPALFLMKLAYAEGNYEECTSCISRVLAHEPNNYDALLMKADVSMAKKDGKQAVADLEYLMAQYPKDRPPPPLVPYQLAAAYLLSGNRAKAMSSLSHCLELDTNYIPAKITISDLNMRQGNSVAAISILTPLLKQTNLLPTAAIPASLILAQSYLIQKSPAQAIAIYRGLAASYPKEAQIPFLEGQAWLTANNLVDARAAFDKSFALNPDYVPALEELVNLDLRESRVADALQRVKAQIDKNPKAPVPWLLQAQIHIQQKENAQAQSDLEKVIEMDPKLPLPYLLLARLYVNQNQQKQALDKLNTLINLTNSVSALMEMGMIHDQLREYDPARQSYEKLLSLDPRSTNALTAGALNNLAYLYSEHFNDLDKAYQLAEKDRELAPYDPYVADTLGWILYKRHDFQRALALMQESMDKQPANAEVHYHVGMAHYMLGDEESARLNLKFALSKSDFEATNEVLRRLKILDLDPKTASASDRASLDNQIQTDPADPIALTRLAALQERDGDFKKAAATYANVIKVSPENARAIIRLAILDSTKLNEAQKGLDLAKNAHALAPDDPYISETLGRLLFQARDYPYARTQLEAAARLLPAQPDLLHDLAWAYFSVGQTAQAQDSMQRAVQTGVPFDKLNDAKQFLDMMAACNNPAQAQAAARVQQVLQADASYAPALMAWGLIQEQQGHGKEAEQSCEEVLAAYPLFLPATRLLSILYARDGNNDAKAYDYAVKAAPAFPDDADLAKVVGLVEYRRKNYAKSLQSLNQSALKKKDDAELLWYQGMDYYALKQTPEAKKALNQAVESKKLPSNLDAQARSVLALLK
jgi:tetratricopeptide (TPR) repeat protein